MIHTWAQATDGTGNAVRVVLIDYEKAFDLIDQSLSKESNPITHANFH